MRPNYLIFAVAIVLFLLVVAVAVILYGQKSGKSAVQNEIQQLQNQEPGAAAGEPQVISREEYERQATSEPARETTGPALLNQ